MTCPPKVVLKLELVALVPCAFSSADEVWLTKFRKAFPAGKLPIRPESEELALEAREFLTVPSVDAARFSETTTEMRS